MKAPHGHTHSPRKRCLRAIRFLVAALLSLAAIHTHAAETWTELEPGLHMASFPVSITDISGDSFTQEDGLTVLRIQPAHYEFVLLTSSEKGIQLTPAQWAEQNNLIAVINASMYLPDNRKSTGYLRNGDHINNDYINKRFGSFFVASPIIHPTALSNGTIPSVAKLPPAAILDKQADDWESMIPQYRIVVQNFRMINASLVPLWPEAGDEFSVAAIAMDNTQAILFIHCRPAVTVRDLTELLLDLPLGLQRAMYVEGGPQASLHIRTGNLRKTWSGRHAGDFWSGTRTEWPLPNVLGIRKR